MFLHMYSSAPFTPRILVSPDSPRKFVLLFLLLGNTLPGNVKGHCLGYLVSIQKTSSAKELYYWGKYSFFNTYWS